MRPVPRGPGRAAPPTCVGVRDGLGLYPSAQSATLKTNSLALPLRLHTFVLRLTPDAGGAPCACRVNVTLHKGFPAKGRRSPGPTSRSEQPTSRLGDLRFTRFEPENSQAHCNGPRGRYCSFRNIGSWISHTSFVFASTGAV